MAMTDIQADRLFDSMLRKLESRLSRKILANFNKLSMLIREVIASDGVFAGNVIIIENQRELEQILIEAYDEAIKEGVKFTRRDLELEEAEEEENNAILLLLLLWRNNTASTHAALMTQTTIDIFNRAVEDAEANGLSGDDLDRSVARTMAKHNRRRVPVISTTEANTAFQTGSEAAAAEVANPTPRTDQPVIGIALLKRWRSQEDRRVRPTHFSANARYKANPIPLSDLFQVGAGQGSRPLDPRLPSEETIACRCFMRFVKAKVAT